MSYNQVVLSYCPSGIRVKLESSHVALGQQAE